jgi:iduronate 2-sulfatase
MDALSRRMFLKAGAAAAATHALPDKAGAAHGKMNVLFIGVDDLNHSLGCYGEPVHTPNLDALAARGTRFDAAYCQYPLCGPSRNSLLSGLAPDTTRCYNNPKPLRDFVPDAVTLPQLFRQNGYYVARVGKIYHAGNPLDEGEASSDDAPSWEYTYNNAGVDRKEEIQKAVIFEKNQNPSPGTRLAAYESPASDREVTDGVGADEVIRLLKANKDKPFFIAYGLYRPHVSWIVPKAYFEKYPLETIHAEPLDPAELTMAPAPAYNDTTPNHGMDPEHARMCKRAYYASTSYMDAQVGRVLDALKETGLDGNTVVVFWADHGWQLGQHGQWEKQTVFEWAARVPFMMAGPGIKQGGVVKKTTEHLDIYPTLVELFGLEKAPKLQGKSMVALLQDPAAPSWDKPAMTQIHRTNKKTHTDGYSLRTERYRYTQWIGEIEGEELYDYQTDPREVHNRAKDASLSETKAKMRAQLTAMREQRTQRVTT